MGEFCCATGFGQGVIFSPVEMTRLVFAGRVFALRCSVDAIVICGDMVFLDVGVVFRLWVKSVRIIQTGSR